MQKQYLWIVSCGNTDVQFPIVLSCDNGWVESRYVLRGNQIRRIHEKLLVLLDRHAISYPALTLETPSETGRDGGRRDEHFMDFDLEIEIDDLTAFASYTKRGKGGEARFITAVGGETLDCLEQPLPIFFPKIEPLLAQIRSIQGGGTTLSVIVLNTCRHSDSGEPIASGPLLASYLAQRLNLSLGTPAPSDEAIKTLRIGANSCTWVNLLQGDERLEDDRSLARVFKRVQCIFDAWEAPSNVDSADKDRHLCVTSTGGINQLKEVIERTSAARYGDKAVSLYNRADEPIGSRVLSYRTKFAEQIALRFHCAEALRNQDWMSAYGIAKRYRDQPWAEEVQTVLGPLLNLRSPTSAWIRSMNMPVLYALRVEAAWTANDPSAAVVALYSFLESALWQLIETNPTLQGKGITVGINPAGNQFLTFSKEQADYLWNLKFENLNLVNFRPNATTVLPTNLLTAWAGWLEENAGKQVPHRKAAKLLRNLCKLYISGTPSLQTMRNSLSHGGSSPIPPEEIGKRFESCFTLTGDPRPFGQNLLGQEQEIGKLLHYLNPDDSDVEAMIDQLRRVTNRVSGRKAN